MSNASERGYTEAGNIEFAEKQQMFARHAEGIAKVAGIELQSTGDAIDPRVVKYVELRSAVTSKGDKNDYSGMSDQQIFVEALRALGDAESVDKMIKTFSNISF